MELANNSNFQVRNFDTLPTFSEHGVLGILIRAITWPLLMLTGTYIFWSFTPILLVIALIHLLHFFLFLKASNRLEILSKALIIISAICIFAPGMTAVIRYMLPVLALGLMASKFND